MTSAIDPTKPADGLPSVKADLRANLLAAKIEIEALQAVNAELGTLAHADSITVDQIDANGIRDATTCLLGDGTFGAKDHPQVSEGEITVGTETTLRSYSPADIVLLVNQHAPAGLGALAQADSITVDQIDASGIRDATTCLLGNGEFGAKDRAQVSAGEIAAGTETALRSYSPADIVSFINQYAPAGTTTSPFMTATGNQAGASSGASWKLTGNVTAVPVTNGWLAKYVNTSGSNKTITPASGVCVKTETGSTQASVTLSNNKSCVVQGDGTNLIVDGDVT
jgi:hypothetical protein